MRPWYARVSRNLGEYQVEAPALAADAFYSVALREPKREKATSLLIGVVLIGAPTFVVAFGFEAMGNPYCFGFALVVWPLLISAYGSPFRTKRLTGLEPTPTDRQVPLLAVAMVFLIAVVFVPSLLHVFVAGHRSPFVNGIRGLLLGIGVASAFSTTRDLVALWLAARGGAPVYARLVDRAPEVQVFFPCPSCGGTGKVAPPSGQMKAGGGPMTCKSCGGSGDEMRRVPVRDLQKIEQPQ